MDKCVWCDCLFDGNEQAEKFDENFPTCDECLFMHEECNDITPNSIMEEKLWRLAIVDERGLSVTYNHEDRIWNIHVDGEKFTSIGLFNLDKAVASALSYVNAS